MFQFVYWLRALAAVMITNAHYADIWQYLHLLSADILGIVYIFSCRGFACTMFMIRF